MIGEKIHHYVITRLIGEGGMASVYEAVHEKLQSKVAIKILNPMLAANSNIRQRFENEARFMAGLTHPNITRVIDFEERPDLLAIILEFLEGEDLNVLIKEKGPMPLPDVLLYFTQVLNAFDYAHNKGIVHRDVKPSNIFIEPTNEVKILDFGIAKLIGAGEDMTMTGTQMGTPVYMSPEQVNTDKTIDHRSDIYSLGVTLYYMLKGQPPYDTTTTSSFQIYTKIVQEPLPELSKYPEIDKIIRIATDKDRAKRFQTCKEFSKALTDAIREKKTAPEPARMAPVADAEKTLIDIPGPVKKEPKPVIEAKEKKKPIITPPAGNKKLRNALIYGLSVLGIVIVVLIKVYPSWFTQIFNPAALERRSEAKRARAVHFLELGKPSFKNPIVAHNYDSAVYYLTEAADLDPDNQEIQYFLGCALYRSDFVDSTNITVLSYNTIEKASEAIEKTISINPEYKGEMINDTDPYSFLTGMWGDLALKYLVKNQPDSALLCLKEGRARGGFNDLSLEIVRNVLNSCDQNAIVFMQYDVINYPVLYVQKIEKLRTDVIPVFKNYLTRPWYFGYMKNSLQVPSSFGETWIGLMSDKYWETQVVSVDNVRTGMPLSWTLYGDAAGKLPKLDQVIFDILTENKFSKPVHYCAIFDFSKGLLNLGQYLQPEGLVYKINQGQSTEWYRAQQVKLQNLRFESAKNSSLASVELRGILDIIRNLYLQLSTTFYDKGDRVNAQLVKRAMEENIPLANYPFQIKEIERSYKSLVNELDYTDDQRKQNEKADIQAYLAKNNLAGTPTSTGLYIIRERAGSGSIVTPGKRLKVHYTGTLLDGTKFDSSYDQGKPLEFTYGTDKMIKGWEEGLFMMQQGSKSLLIIPYELGYGSSTNGIIPSYSTLIYEVEVLEVI